jgi:hypothetical protein
MSKRKKEDCPEPSAILCCQKRCSLARLGHVPMAEPP